jgi:hypothetical protein
MQDTAANTVITDLRGNMSLHPVSQKGLPMKFWLYEMDRESARNISGLSISTPGVVVFIKNWFLEHLDQNPFAAYLIARFPPHYKERIPYMTLTLTGMGDDLIKQYQTCYDTVNDYGLWVPDKPRPPLALGERYLMFGENEYGEDDPAADRWMVKARPTLADREEMAKALFRRMRCRILNYSSNRILLGEPRMNWRAIVDIRKAFKSGRAWRKQRKDEKTAVYKSFLYKCFYMFNDNFVEDLTTWFNTTPTTLNFPEFYYDQQGLKKTYACVLA